MKIATLVLLAACLAAAAHAQETFGIVELADTEARDLEKAKIQLEGAARKWQTLTPDEVGGYLSDEIVQFVIFKQVPSGKRKFRIEKSLYEPLEFEIEVVAGQKTLIALSLVATKENRLTILVTDAKGGPIENAPVRLDGAERGFTDKRGQLVLRDAFREGGSTSVRVEADGYEYSEPLSAKEPGKTVTVKLSQATAVRGTINGADGTRVPLSVVPEGDNEANTEYGECMSQSNGSYCVTLRSGGYRTKYKGGRVVLRANFLGIGLTSKLGELKAGAWAEATLTAPRGGSISGRVTGPDGKPMGGVRIRINKSTYFSSPSTLTDAKGNYRFGRVPQGEFELEIQRHSKLTFVQARPSKVTITEGQETVRNFDYTGTLTVRVRGFLDNVLCTMVSMEDGGSVGDTSAWGSTNERCEGWCTFVGLTPGSYELHLQTSANRDARLRVSVEQSDKPILIERHVGKASVKGKVKLPDGLETKIRAKWRIVLYERYFGHRRVPIAADGSYAIADVEPGEYHISAEIPGWCSAWLPLKVEGETVKDIEVAKAATVRVTVKIVGFKAEKLQGGFGFYLNGNWRPYDNPWGLGGINVKPGEKLIVHESLEPGQYTLGANVYPADNRDLCVLETEDKEIELKAGEITDVEFELKLGSKIRLEGLPAGIGLQDFWVEDDAGEKPKSRASLGANAQIASGGLSNIPPGKYKLVIEVTGYKRYEKDVELEPGKTLSLDIKLERAK